MKRQDWREMPIPPLKSHQFYTACRKVLGIGYLAQMFHRSHKTIYAWGADPDFCEDARRNPMDRYEHLLERLCELGKDDIARAAVARQARIVNCTLVCEDEVVPDKPDWVGEVLDDHPALVEFHEACRAYREGKAPPELVQHLKDEVIREIKETVASVLSGGCGGDR